MNAHAPRRAVLAPSTDRGSGGDLLADLRGRDREPDWRRAAGDPDAHRWADRFVREAASWPDADRHEARALLGRMRLDAATTIEALSELAAVDAGRRSWALQHVARMARAWDDIEARLNGDDLAGFRGRAMAALGALIQALPRQRPPHVALAAALRAAEGVDAALDHLEHAAQAGAPVDDLRLGLLCDTLEQSVRPALMRRALAIAVPIEGGAGPAYGAFRVRLAVIAASIRATRPHLVRELGVPEPAAGPVKGIAAAMSDARAAAVALGAGEAAQLFHAIASSALFRHSPLPEAEEARLALIEAVFALAESAGGAAARQPLLGTLNLVLPCTLRFWEDAAWRRDRSGRIVALAAGLPEPPRSWFRGKFGFAREDYALAAEAFAAAAAADPKAVGPGTYLDHRAVPAKLAARGDGPLLGAEGGTFEVLAKGAGPARTTVIVVANDRYLRRYGAAYARSLARFEPSGHLHVHLVGDPSQMADWVAALPATIPGGAATFSSEPLTTDAPYYFATARFLRLPDWLDRFPGRIVVTDIDSPWRTAPERFLDAKLGEADAGLALGASVRVGQPARLAFPGHLYPLPAPWVAVAAWAIALNPTPGARRFADLLARLADGELRAAAAKPPAANWAIDQNILCAAYAHAVRHCPGISFADLGSPSEAADRPDGQQTPPPRGSHWIGRP